jgi:hypothetical protein
VEIFGEDSMKDRGRDDREVFRPGALRRNELWDQDSNTFESVPDKLSHLAVRVSKLVGERLPILLSLKLPRDLCCKDRDYELELTELRRFARALPCLGHEIRNLRGAKPMFRNEDAFVGTAIVPNFIEVVSDQNVEVVDPIVEVVQHRLQSFIGCGR